MSIITLEDVNSILLEYQNIPFWDETSITSDTTSDYSNKHYNYLTVTREKSGSNYTFTINVDNSIKTGHYYAHTSNGAYINNVTESDGTITVETTSQNITFHTLLFVQADNPGFNKVQWIIDDITPKLASQQNSIQVTVTLKEVDTSFNVNGKTFTVNNGNSSQNVVCSSKKLSFTLPYNDGYNFTITYSGVSYNCIIPSTVKNVNIIEMPSNLTLINGRENTFELISTSETLDVSCDYPVSIEGKEVILDLTDKDNNKPLTLLVTTLEDEDYYKYTQTFQIPCEYPTINNESDLTSLLSHGGKGVLQNDITLTGNLTVNKSAILLGQDNTIDCNGNQIIISEGLTFKAQNTTFSNGTHAIHQKHNTTLELRHCTFTTCTTNTGLGSCIDCDISLGSLAEPNDYITNIYNCTFTDNDSAIYHGGQLQIQDSIVNGKVNTDKQPYFLYMTDGEANIQRTHFNLTHTGSINNDITFAACIFIVGETAIVNNGGTAEYSKNDVQGFLQSNTSKINVTYLYDLIQDYITLESENGYCHSISGTDYVFKTNVDPKRE